MINSFEQERLTVYHVDYVPAEGGAVPPLMEPNGSDTRAPPPRAHPAQAQLRWNAAGETQAFSAQRPQTKAGKQSSPQGPRRKNSRFTWAWAAGAHSFCEQTDDFQDITIGA